MIQIIASVLFVGFVIYQYITRSRWWNLLANLVVFVIVSILVATFAWDLGFPPSFVGYMVIIRSGSGGFWSWVISILFVGSLIPPIFYGIGWLLKGMDEEDYFDKDIRQPFFIRTRSGWRINW